MMKTLDQPLCQLRRMGKVDSLGWLRYSGFARKDPKLDAAGVLADLLVF